MSVTTILGFPLFIVIVVTVHHFLMPLVGDRWYVTGLGASLGICMVYFLRGIDQWLDQKKDNPEPFDVPKPNNEAFAAVLEVLEHRHMGPNFWSIRKKDTEEMVIQGLFDFTEQYQMLGQQPIMMQRMMMLTISFESIPEEG